MPDSSLAAFGVVVEDLERSIRFYTDVIGMKEAHRVDVPDLGLVESIMSFPAGVGSSLVLMHFDDGADHSYVDIGGKIVVAVDDAVAMTEAARAAGSEVTREPSEYPGFGLIAMVKDPDGYTVEIVQSITPAT